MSKYFKVLWTSPCKFFRVTQLEDTISRIEDLKGDMFNFESIQFRGTREELAVEESEFEALVEREGIFGFELERWNPAPDCGWEHVDSCYGLVGPHSPTNKHSIVEEFIEEGKRLAQESVETIEVSLEFEE